MNETAPTKVKTKRIKILPISENKGPVQRKGSSDNDTIISGLGISDNSLNLDGLLAKSPQSNFKSSINLLSSKAIKEETVEESPYLPRPRSRPSNLIDMNDKYSSVSVSRRNSDSVDFDLISKRSRALKGSGKLLIDLQEDSPEWTPKQNSSKFLLKQLQIPSSIDVLSPKMESSSEMNPLFNLNQSMIPQRTESIDSQLKMINSKDLEESPSNILNEARASFAAKRNSSANSQYQTFTENSNVFAVDEAKLFSVRNIQTPRRMSLFRDETLTFRPDSPGNLESSPRKMREEGRLSQGFKSEILTNKMRMVEVLRRAQKNRQKRGSLFQSLGKGSGIKSPISASESDGFGGGQGGVWIKESR